MRLHCSRKRTHPCRHRPSRRARRYAPRGGRALLRIVPSARHLHTVSILQTDATGAEHHGRGGGPEKHCRRTVSGAALHLVRGGTRGGKLPTELAPAANFMCGTDATCLMSARSTRSLPSARVPCRLQRYSYRSASASSGGRVHSSGSLGDKVRYSILPPVGPTIVMVLGRGSVALRHQRSPSSEYVRTTRSARSGRILAVPIDVKCDDVR
jgi:hypothetical protein